MLIHQYWEQVLGSRIKVKILRLLCRFPRKKFTLRELARMSQVAHTPVLRSLGDLQGMNLVRLARHGTANSININTKSCLYPSLQYIFAQEMETKARLEKRIKSLLPPHLEMAVLFGSIQKGEENMGSDVDLLLVTKNKAAAEKGMLDARLAITEEFGNHLAPMILTVREFQRKRKMPFASDLSHNYKLIAGEDLIQKWWKHDKNQKRR